MVSKSSPSITAMAESRIIRNLMRRWTASGSDVFVIMIEKTGDSTLLLDNACNRTLLLKVVGWELVLCVCDGDFMVVGWSIKFFSAEWSLRTEVGFEKVTS
jgi:hypothetical protein